MILALANFITWLNMMFFVMFYSSLVRLHPWWHVAYFCVRHCFVNLNHLDLLDQNKIRFISDLTYTSEGTNDIIKYILFLLGAHN